MGKLPVFEMLDLELLDYDLIRLVLFFVLVFEMLDLDGGGTIEEEELRIGLQSVGKNPTPQEMQRMMDQV